MAKAKDPMEALAQAGIAATTGIAAIYALLIPVAMNYAPVQNLPVLAVCWLVASGWLLCRAARLVRQ